ncbi:LppU/SCO3897 family protein [Streptomyces sp. NPDC054861]
MTTTPPPVTPEQPAAFGEPVAPAEPPKKGGLGKKILGIVAAIAIALGVKFGYAAISGDLPTHAEAGDCITVTGPDNDPKVETKGCDDKAPDLYKVTKVVDGTFDVEKCGELSALAQEWEHEKFVLCLQPVKN